MHDHTIESIVPVNQPTAGLLIDAIRERGPLCSLSNQYSAKHVDRVNYLFRAALMVQWLGSMPVMQIDNSRPFMTSPKWLRICRQT